jgi:hypothetical protein
MEKYDSADEFDIQWDESTVEYNETTPEEESDFVKSILGVPYEVPVDERPAPRREYEEFPDTQETLQQIHDKYHPPYETAGGKKIRIVKDAWGTFWHVEFTSGGQLPAELDMKFTNEQEADKAIQVYLAKQV